MYRCNVVINGRPVYDWMRCHCFVCLDDPSEGLNNPTVRYMVLCKFCRNKRCPHATSHEHECTRSNEPGQPGSRYGGVELKILCNTKPMLDTLEKLTK